MRCPTKPTTLAEYCVVLGFIGGVLIVLGIMAVVTSFQLPGEALRTTVLEIGEGTAAMGVLVAGTCCTVGLLIDD